MDDLNLPDEWPPDDGLGACRGCLTLIGLGLILALFGVAVTLVARWWQSII